MELQTQAIDRVLEALAPALSAELERILHEAQQSLEAEFQKKLQEAVRDAEAAARDTAAVQLAKTVDETRDSVRKQVTDELQAQFRRTLQETTDELRATLTKEHQGKLQSAAAEHQSKVQSASADWAAERSRLTEQLNEWRLFAEAQKQLLESGSQSEILARFLRLAERFAPSIALYVAKSDGLTRWKALGNGAFPETVSQGTVNPQLFFRQIVVRDKVVAAVCAAQPYREEGLGFLGDSLERAIESYGAKVHAPIPKPAPPEPTPAEVDSEKMHGEARRMARLLVSEIKLYHEQEVRDGRANSDLYVRLRTEIENGREEYRQRVPVAVLASSDYFSDEVVRVLAENDASRLGDTYPGNS